MFGAATVVASLGLLSACALDDMTHANSKLDTRDASGSSAEQPRDPFAVPVNPDNEPTSGDAGAPDESSVGDASTVLDASRSSEPTPGDIVISEVMYDPTLGEPTNEWFEVHNPTAKARSLSGLTIVDGANRAHVIRDGVSVPPGGWVVLARNTAAAIAAGVPAPAIVYEYGLGIAESTGILLANGATGKVTLRAGDTIIAGAAYGAWFEVAAGRSVQLSALGQSQLQESWCLSLNPWSTGADRGTPGRPPDCT
jgi:hypothetical protein